MIAPYHSIIKFKFQPELFGNELTLLPIAIHVPVVGDQGRRSYRNEKGRGEREREGRSPPSQCRRQME